jgi:hypothetical protein
MDISVVASSSPSDSSSRPSIAAGPEELCEWIADALMARAMISAAP